MEFLSEQLRDLNSCEDRGEEKNHGVCAGWNHDARVLCQTKRRDELQGRDGCRVNATELQVRFLEGSEARNSMLSIIVTDEACLRTEQGVEDQLNTVNL